MPRISPPHALPAGSILLHIGAHKTGTTSIQAALYSAREALAAQGVHNLVPRDHETANIAARAAQRLPPSGTSGSPVPYEVWEQMVASSESLRGSRMAISAESFAVSEPSVISNIARDLGRDRLHVVITLRPLAKILPSQWQQDLHGAWQSQAFDSWLEEVLRDPRPSLKLGPIEIPHPFWFRHRHDFLVNRWADVLGTERITVVVVDDHRKESLFETFEQLLGVRDGTLPRDVSARNQSMTLQEMVIMQRYGELLENSELGRRVVAQARYHRALRILRKIRPNNTRDARLQIPSWSHEPVGEIQEEMRTHFENLEVGVIGILDRLVWLPSQNADEALVESLVPESELDRITQKMLKSAARRVGISQSDYDRKNWSLTGRLSRAFSWMGRGSSRAIRLAARFIRIRI